MPRIVRHVAPQVSASTLATAPQATAPAEAENSVDGDELVEELADETPEAAATTVAAAVANNTAPSEAPAAPEKRQRRARGQLGVAAAAATVPTAAAVPANLPTLTAGTLQGLGLLYVLSRSMGVAPDQAVSLLREAISAHDALTAPVTAPTAQS
jgi:hypothetical protein